MTAWESRYEYLEAIDTALNGMIWMRRTLLFHALRLAREGADPKCKPSIEALRAIPDEAVKHLVSVYDSADEAIAALRHAQESDPFGDRHPLFDQLQEDLDKDPI